MITQFIAVTISLGVVSFVLGCGSFGYFVIKKKFKPGNSHVLSVEEIRSMAMDCFFCVGRVKHTSGKFPIKVRWKKPDLNWFKLNTDGLALDNLGLAGGDGIIRDHNENWM